MPTNKLWTEHTERAAWQSVEALREKLAEAEKRQQRLAPPVEGWRELLDALDAARAEHVIAGDGYAALIRGVLERLNAAEARVRALEQGGVPAAPPPPAVLETAPLLRAWRARDAERELDDDFDETTPADRGREPSREARRLFAEIHRRQRAHSRDPGRRDAAALLAGIEARLEELPEPDAAELVDVAADLGALALWLEESGRED